MATPPTKQSVLNLYHSMLRTSQSFTSYNFRTYFVRRTKSTFREIHNESDPAKLAAFYAEKSQELAVLKRSAIVNQLYGGRRLVVEDQKPVRDRGDT
ncbi:uncharacterized protein BXZ73DRAFT_48731 [Epithele typhae]|uniref:uncharacterized protein n=1 Tax=Epithele typhae TaxID=378194 RepID=UPI0020087B0B|nr:uncharacterized protein BXZ73DRAFT_48731 [Epithele typhae]KAH9927951.1 hypothetical protein BXZ73DRAFT_48731 [Epithele typhae]